MLSLVRAMTETRIYFIQCGEAGPIKVGYASDVASRLSAMQTGNPEELYLRAHMPGGPEQEEEIHNRLFSRRVRGEWFSNSAEVWNEINYARTFCQDLPGKDNPWSSAVSIARNEDQDKFMRLTFVAALRRAFPKCRGWKQQIAEVAGVSIRTVDGWLRMATFPYSLALLRLLEVNEDVRLWYRFTADVFDTAERYRLTCREALSLVPLPTAAGAP